MKRLLLAATALLALNIGAVSAEDYPPAGASAHLDNYSPYVEDSFPQNVYFGDTHLHTSWSTDAGMVGATVGPDEAYTVAKGGVTTAYSGFKVKLIRPLDFIVIADHAENLGLADFIRRSDPIILANKTGKKWHDWVKAGKGYDAFLEWLRSDKIDLINEPRMMESVWAKVVANADKYNDPGKFTAFHGYEWTSMPDGNNLHRVVIFRDGADKTSQTLPYTMYDSVDPEGLWNYLADYEKSTGGKVLAIAHNGNLSNGLMFDNDKTFTGGALTKEYAQTRIRWEPLYEVTQMKGDGESHPFLSPNDGFADFENLDKGNISGKVAKTKEMLPKEYGRSALKNGLALEKTLGINPYKFGMIGSTDAHTGLPTTREDNNFSKAHVAEPNAKRAEHVLIQGVKPELSIMIKDIGASGLAAVWAEENTRESIWDAMSRKEVYATTGSRLKVRVFGGWGFELADSMRPDFAKQGYSKGVPMGGDLTNAPAGKAPSFIINSVRDADGANLDRVQIIKGWLDGDGNTQERIYDVACSDGRKIKKRRCKGDVGNTVDIADASYVNSIGDATLNAYWADPDFDAAQRSFYYVRVIEIPTPRWTAYDAKFFNITMSEDTKMEVQDRAYTSPIWYTP